MRKLRNFNMQRRFSLLFALLWAAPLHAAPLSWDQCVQLLKKNNEELIAMKANVEASEFREGSATAAFLPQISGSLSYGKTDTQAPTPGESEGYGAGVSLSQNLFAGFSDMAKRKQAKAATVVTRRDLELLEARLSKDLKVAYENYLFAERSIQLRESIVNRRQENVRLVDLRFQGGRENKGSVLLSKAILSEAKLDVTQARLMLRTARADLAKILGIDDHESVEVTGDIPVNDPPAAETHLRSLSFSTPAVKKAEAQEEIAQAALTASRSGFFPSLTLNAGINRSDTDFFPEANKNWTVGATLSIPLFNGGRDYYETRAQGRALLSAIKQRVKSQRDSLVILEATLSDYIQAVERVRVNKEFVDAVTVRAEIGRMRYNNGLMTFDDWYNIENELIDRQKKYLESRRDRVHRESSWEEAQGKGVFQ
ncbi:MAG TPA: TolC family protein [Pseudobdellovibrionaceae bacterium]|nr:TolC family protein [Pseudobdellovibrionaceae bacterium]